MNLLDVVKELEDIGSELVDLKLWPLQKKVEQIKKYLHNCSYYHTDKVLRPEFSYLLYKKDGDCILPMPDRKYLNDYFNLREKSNGARKEITIKKDDLPEGAHSVIITGSLVEYDIGRNKND